jgi:hypothetical protein
VEGDTGDCLLQLCNLLRQGIQFMLVIYATISKKHTKHIKINLMPQSPSYAMWVYLNGHCCQLRCGERWQSTSKWANGCAHTRDDYDIVQANARTAMTDMHLQQDATCNISTGNVIYHACFCKNIPLVIRVMWLWWYSRCWPWQGKLDSSRTI